MNAFPPPADLLPHRPPMVLLDAVLSSDGDTTRCRRMLADGQPLVEAGRARAVLAIELMAQTCAVHRALRAPEGRAPRGFLAGVPSLDLSVGALAVGDVLEVAVTLVSEAGPLRSFDGVVMRDGAEVARARLQVVEVEEAT